MTLKIDIGVLLDKKINDIEKHIDGLDKCRLKDIKFLDLLVAPNGKQAMRHGVYLFFNTENKCVYVGKCGSSHLAGRLSAHFGMSPKHRMNTFLKRCITNMPKLEEYSPYRKHVEALKEVEKYSYLMIAVNQDLENKDLYVDYDHKKRIIRELEKIFMAIFFPTSDKNNSQEHILNKFGKFSSNLGKSPKKARVKLDEYPDKTLKEWIKELAPAKIK